MGLKKLAEKVDDYKARLEGGKAGKIKPGDVEKVLAKLRKKTSELEQELAEATTDEDRARFERKLGIAQAHIERAEWLLAELD